MDLRLVGAGPVREGRRDPVNAPGAESIRISDAAWRQRCDAANRGAAFVDDRERSRRRLSLAAAGRCGAAGRATQKTEVAGRCDRNCEPYPSAMAAPGVGGCGALRAWRLGEAHFFS